MLSKNVRNVKWWQSPTPLRELIKPASSHTGHLCLRGKLILNLAIIRILDNLQQPEQCLSVWALTKLSMSCCHYGSLPFYPASEARSPIIWADPLAGFVCLLLCAVVVLRACLQPDIHGRYIHLSSVKASRFLSQAPPRWLQSLFSTLFLLRSVSGYSSTLMFSKALGQPPFYASQSVVPLLRRANITFWFILQHQQLKLPILCFYFRLVSGNYALRRDILWFH